VPFIHAKKLTTVSIHVPTEGATNNKLDNDEGIVNNYLLN